MFTIKNKSNKFSPSVLKAARKRIKRAGDSPDKLLQLRRDCAAFIYRERNRDKKQILRKTFNERIPFDTPNTLPEMLSTFNIGDFIMKQPHMKRWIVGAINTQLYYKDKREEEVAGLKIYVYTHRLETDEEYEKRVRKIHIAQAVIALLDEQEEKERIAAMDAREAEAERELKKLARKYGKDKVRRAFYKTLND